MKTDFFSSVLRFMALFAAASVIPACSAADPALEASATNGESVESVEQAGMGPIHLVCSILCKPTTSCSTACIGNGTCGAYGVCAQADPDGDSVPTGSDNCPNAYNPGQANCDGDTLGDACETDLGRYVLAAPTFAICHIDPDTHIDGVDVELYTADLYRDTSCLRLPDGYRKREVASVHCGFHSSGTCESRVTQRIIELAAQGFYPATTGDDGDQCPYPRIPDGALAPPPVTPRPPRPPGPIP